MVAGARAVTATTGGGASGVSSFNTRTGVVVPDVTDYLAVPLGGLTGAVAATRYVGGTTSGAPASGTFAVGDFVVDQTGKLWICTTAGTPGTWTQAGAGVSSFNTRTGAVVPGVSDYLAVPVGGLTGATTATRFVGGTTSGAPASGTFAVGDFVVDQTGKLWICTTAGTPGTWTQVGAGAGVSSFNTRTGAVVPGVTDYLAVPLGGLTGATTATRFVGGTTAGAPTSGTFAVGDFVVDRTATIWICTVSGTPGTWSPVVPNSLVLRSATATAGLGELTIFTTSGTSGQTITLPANPQNGASYAIKNISSFTVNILGGTNSISIAGTTYSAATPYTIPLNTEYNFVYSGSLWYCFGTTDLAACGGTTAILNGGTGATTAATALANLGGQPGTSQRSVFTTAGAYSGTAPAWANSAIVYLVGGGGGGGAGALSTTGFGGGGGGAAGTVVARTIPVTPGTSYSGVVGAGGTGGASASGTRGTNTTLTTTGALGVALTANGGQFGQGCSSTTNGSGGLYGTAANVGGATSTGSGGTGSTNTSQNAAPGPIPFGAGGGSGGYPQSGSVGGNGGNGGTTTGGQSGGTAGSTTSGTAGTAGESSSSTSPGGGGGGGGGAAFTAGTAGAGAAGGTGSVVIVWQAS